MTGTTGTLVYGLAALRLCLGKHALPDGYHGAGFLEPHERRSDFVGGDAAEVLRPPVANVVCQRGDFLRGQTGEGRHATPALVDAPDESDGIPEPVIAAQRREPGRIPHARVPMAKRTVLQVELLSLPEALLSAGGRD